MKQLDRKRNWPQHRLVLDHLRRHKATGITPALAREVYGIQRLAPRIFELRQKGHRISSVLEQDDMGRPFSRYRLKQEVKR